MACTGAKLDGVATSATHQRQRVANGAEDLLPLPFGTSLVLDLASGRIQRSRQQLERRLRTRRHCRHDEL